MNWEHGRSKSWSDVSSRACLAKMTFVSPFVGRVPKIRGPSTLVASFWQYLMDWRTWRVASIWGFGPNILLTLESRCPSTNERLNWRWRVPSAPRSSYPIIHLSFPDSNQILSYSSPWSGLLRVPNQLRNFPLAPDILSGGSMGIG